MPHSEVSGLLRTHPAALFSNRRRGEPGCSEGRAGPREAGRCRAVLSGSPSLSRTHTAGNLSFRGRGAQAGSECCLVCIPS